MLRCKKCRGKLWTVESLSTDKYVVRKKQCLTCGESYFTEENIVDYKRGLDLMAEARRDNYQRRKMI